jgi:hypothetical protein
MTNNESRFFQNLLMQEMIEYSSPLTNDEIDQIYYDVASGNFDNPLREFARRIEYSHGIGIKKRRIA